MLAKCFFFVVFVGKKIKLSFANIPTILLLLRYLWHEAHLFTLFKSMNILSIELIQI